MAHIGLLCPTAIGHLNSLLPLGCELQRRGHRVTVFQVADAKATVEAAGLSLHQIGAATFPKGRIAEITDRLGELNGLAAIRYSVDWIKQTTQLFLTEVPDAIQAAGVELLIIDQIVVEGDTIAQRVGLPFITFCSALPLHPELTIPPFITPWEYSETHWAKFRNRLGYTLLDRLTQPVTKLIQDYRQRWQLPRYAASEQPNSPLLQLSHQPAAFEYPRTTLPPWFHFVGPLHSSRARSAIAFPWERLHDQPLIYASMGTLQNRQQWIFETIAQACANLPVQLVISLGNPHTDSLPSLPGNPIVVPYAPQLELLPKASLTITHAGLNTTLESLTHGVPLVAIPVTNDQPGVAARIAWTGAGEALSLSRLTAPRLQAAIERVSSQPQYRANALRLQQSIQRSGGVQLAADLVEQAIITQQPVIQPWIKASEPRLGVHQTPFPSVVDTGNAKEPLALTKS